MLPYQQQPQQQQPQQPIDPNSSGHNLQGLGGFGFNNVNFGGNPGNFNGNMGLNDFAALEQHGLGLPLSQASPASVLQTQGIVSSQQPQPFSPTAAAQQPQNLMMQNNTPVNAAALQAQFQQGRALYQAGAMSPNNAQTRLYQQQQAAAAAMAMNRARQHSPSSPSSAHHTNIGSPMAANSPQQQSRMGSDYGNSSASPSQNQMMGVQPSPQLNRIIPSQTVNNTSASPYSMQVKSQQQQDNMPMYNPSDSNSPSTSGSGIQVPSSITPQDSRMKQPSTPGYTISPSVGSTTPDQRPPSTSNEIKPDPSTPQHQQQQQQLQQNSQEKEPMDTSSSAASDIETQQQQQQEQQQDSPRRPDPVTYVPKTRNVETYGGVDLKYFDMFEIKPMVAQLPELGTIDIHAVIMSLKSGMKMEMANALNTLTMLTVHTPMALGQCDDLLDSLLDILDQDFFGYGRTTTTEDDNNVVQVNYANLFDMSLDEMKSLIPTLEDSTSEIWLSLRERCLCILNLLRNFSFIPTNVDYLATHSRFVATLLKLLNYTRGIKEEDWDDARRSEAWFVGVRRMDTLDHRKSVLMIFSNIGVRLRLADPTMARAFVRLLHDFLTHGPDTYYSLLASETLAKIAVGYENQKVLAELVNSNPQVEFPWIEDIWAELTAVIRKDYFMPDGRVLGNISLAQLAALEMVIMGLYDIILIVDNAALKDQLLLRDKSAPMTILRLCITLGESGNQQFSVVTRRGMELVRGLLCGGDGIRPRRSDPANLRHTGGGISGQVSSSTPSASNSSSGNNGDSICLSPYAHKVLDVTSVREKLVQAMLMKSTDIEVLADLVELLDLIDNEHVIQQQ